MNNRRGFLKTTLALSSVLLLPKINFATGKPLSSVLILGDSISIGYTSFVRSMLQNVALVKRPVLDNGKPENCEGTTKAVLNMKRWLGDTKWDVIHFNFGLHDLKHVDPNTGKNSTKPTDPLQADLKQYKKNLKKIVDELKSTGADLIFATTTPYPDQVDGPLRDPGMAEMYNKVAVNIMNRNHIGINELYTFVKPRQEEIQLPHNVHFTNKGYRLLGEKVIDRIKEVLEDRNNN